MKTRRVFSSRRYRYLGSKNLLRCDICDGDSCMVSHGGTAYHRCTEPVEVPRYLWHVTYRLSGRDRAIRKFGLLRSKPLKESFYRYKHQGSSIGYLEDIHLTEADESKLSKGETLFEGHVYAHKSIDDFFSLHPIYMDSCMDSFRTRQVALWRIDAHALGYPWYTDPYIERGEKWIYGNSFRTPNNIPNTALELFKFGDLYAPAIVNGFKEVHLKKGLQVF